MSIYLGNTEIGQIYLGNTEISEAYLGSDLVYDAGGVLPYDAEVEYLQSQDAGTRIATGVKGDGIRGSIYRWEAKIGYAQSSNRKFVACLADSNHIGYCEINVNGAFGSFLGNQSASITTPYISPNTMYNIYMQIDSGNSISSYVDINGEWQGNTSTSAQTVINSNIEFVLYQLGYSFNGINVRIGRNKLYHNGEIVRDFVPVRIGTVGYMYDKVSEQLFSNMGSNPFIIGNDINT